MSACACLFVTFIELMVLDLFCCPFFSLMNWNQVQQLLSTTTTWYGEKSIETLKAALFWLSVCELINPAILIKESFEFDEKRHRS